jgi:hypothetical protein
MPCRSVLERIALRVQDWAIMMDDDQDEGVKG